MQRRAQPTVVWKSQREPWTERPWIIHQSSDLIVRLGSPICQITSTACLWQSKNIWQDVYPLPLRVNSSVHFMERPLPALLPRSVCGSLRGGMRRVFPPRQDSNNQKKNGVFATGKSRLITPPPWSCRSLLLNNHTNVILAISRARVARASAPRAALIWMRKKMDLLPS